MNGPQQVDNNNIQPLNINQVDRQQDIGNNNQHIPNINQVDHQQGIGNNNPAINNEDEYEWNNIPPPPVLNRHDEGDGDDNILPQPPGLVQHRRRNGLVWNDNIPQQNRFIREFNIPPQPPDLHRLDG